jgi:deazaflavin-dependent oxidoreductase (nitroreductase family)
MRLLRALASNPVSYRLMLKWHRLIPPIERVLRWASRGRTGVLELAGLPAVRLTVAGRRSGLPRTATVQYVPDGQSLLLVGSNWGLPTHPKWAHNLSTVRQATIERDGKAEPVAVEQLTGDARERAWAKIVDFWPNYQIAQSRAGTRTFWIFALSPISQ